MTDLVNILALTGRSVGLALLVYVIIRQAAEIRPENILLKFLRPLKYLLLATWLFFSIADILPIIAFVLRVAGTAEPSWMAQAISITNSVLYVLIAILAYRIYRFK